MDIERRYQNGEVIPAHDFNDTKGLTLFGEIVLFDWIAEKTIRQLGLDGELYYQKIYPQIILTPEQTHALRPSDTREGRRLQGI